MKVKGSLKFCSAAGSKSVQLLLSRVLKILFQSLDAGKLALAEAEAEDDCGKHRICDRPNTTGQAYASFPLYVTENPPYNNCDRSPAADDGAVCGLC